MLVLSRKVGEKIVIDGGITITINRIDGNRVSLALDAPREVHIMRGELREFQEEAPVEQPAPQEPAPRRSRIRNHHDSRRQAPVAEHRFSRHLVLPAQR